MKNVGGRGRRTPTNVLDLNGRLKHDRKRYEKQGRFTEPVEERPLDDAPEENLLTFDEAWAIVVDLCPKGVLRRRDRAMVQLAASLLEQTQNYRVLCRLEDKGWAFENPGYMKAAGQLSSVLSKLGLSPVDASKVRGESAPEKPRNEFDD